jgi:2-polyprenyl-6-methoxyphenol hydroxylase-like FAD-dependent oxidoreductase
MIRILRAETNALPPAMATIVQATQAPFVQAITEAVAPQAVFEDGRVLLWADALCNIRPHTGSGAAHAARQAEALHDILQATPGDFTEEQRRRISEEWEPDALAYAHSLHRLGKEMGQAALRASHPMRGDL